MNQSRRVYDTSKKKNMVNDIAENFGASFPYKLSKTMEFGEHSNALPWIFDGKMFGFVMGFWMCAIPCMGWANVNLYRKRFAELRASNDKRSYIHLMKVPSIERKNSHTPDGLWFQCAARTYTWNTVRYDTIPYDIYTADLPSSKRIFCASLILITSSPSSSSL